MAGFTSAKRTASRSVHNIVKELWRGPSPPQPFCHAIGRLEAKAFVLGLDACGKPQLESFEMDMQTAVLIAIGTGITFAVAMTGAIVVSVQRKNRRRFERPTDAV